MSVGNAQRYEIGRNDLPLFKMYHYEAGGSVSKPIWSDAGKTTPLAQPVSADANGNLTFFADGIYRMKFHDSSDVPISGMDYDDFEITADKSTTFELNQGTILPSATAANKGHVFLLFDVSSNILGVYRSDGTQYKAMSRFTATGDQIFESVITKSMPVYNVLHSDWGAIGDGVTDDTAAVQAAINAIPTIGGVLYFPTNKYKLTSKLIVTNKNIYILGDGIGLTRLCWTASGGVDYDTTTATHMFLAEGLSLQTDFAGAGDALNLAWASVDFTRPKCDIRNIEISPEIGSESTAYFTRGIYISNSPNSYLGNISLHGKLNSHTDMTHGIYLTDSCIRSQILNCTSWYAAKAVLLDADANGVIISNLDANYVNYGVHMDYAVARSNNQISGCKIEAFTYPVYCNKVIDSGINKNNLTKYPDSTEDFFGIVLDADSDSNKVNDNSIKGTGTSGTDTGISVAGESNKVSDNFVEDQDVGIHCTSTSALNSVTDNRAENNTDDYKDDSTAKTNLWQDNYKSEEENTFTDADTTPSVYNTSGRIAWFLSTSTASVTITSFDDGYTGQIIQVKDTNGNTKITTGGNIILKTGSPPDVFAAGNWVTFCLSPDGNWYQWVQRT